MQGNASGAGMAGGIARGLVLALAYIKLGFSLPEPATVRLVIYGEQAETIKTLVDATMPAGQFRLSWNFFDEEGRRAPDSAIYTYSLWINDQLRRESILESPQPIWE